MRVLLVGNGGREHAIAWKLSQSPRVTQLFVAPGNGGTSMLDRTENVSIGAEDLQALRDFAIHQQIDLTVVGPEAPLVAGIVDVFRADGLRIFGPTRLAAQLEGSKAFSKRFMQQYNIPTGRAEMFSNMEEAITYLDSQDETPVIKASGLAAGKGVIIPESKAAAREAVRAMLVDRQFGGAGETVLIEERLRGTEVSVLAFCDGRTVAMMPTAQDHKRFQDNDLGPNTGGMGAFAPSPLGTSQLLDQVQEEVLLPTLRGLEEQSVPYTGVLYAGLMLTPTGPKVLEFNCRLGDPETQVILPLLETDLVDIMLACLDGNLADVRVDWRNESAVTVVMASQGYPGPYETGVEIQGIDNAERQECMVFQAGTRLAGGNLETAGGRVLAITALGCDLAEAASKAYNGVRHIRFEGCKYRTDIGRHSACA